MSLAVKNISHTITVTLTSIHCINIFTHGQNLAAINTFLSRINNLTIVIYLTFILDEAPLHKYFQLYIEIH